MGIDHVPSNNFKPEAPDDLIEQGFRERDAVMMLTAMLKLTSERELRDTLDLLAKGLPEQRKVNLEYGGGDALHDAADYDLLRLADLCRSLKEKDIEEIRTQLGIFRNEELKRRNGFSPQA